MKIALCFSGQPRFVKEIYPSIKKYLIGNYQFDVFAHLWFDEKLRTEPYKYGGAGGWEHQRISVDAIKVFEELYQPKKIKVEPSKVFKYHNLTTKLCHYPDGKVIEWSKHWQDSQEPDYRNRIVHNNISNFYSLQQVNLLKQAYEFENDFQYDLVIRCRTDTILHHNIQYELLDKKYVYYTNTLNQPDGMIADWINIGNSENMDVFMNTFGNIRKVFELCISKHHGCWSNEMLHRITLDLFNIPHQGLPIYVSLPRF